ncbi:hypothetical protein VFPPC_18231 [Pochonia chlamydosporia 170]|uniref:Uncharacterized protein n=1 Tax=Pochonia chlamydosporia 170 TaxID=1380566 RepID=A0A219APS9_METCM|nr:hypothetical protein VFPPC_18231 [Pochonia chlamydosporia 170]OWT42619.1 hypothetical protein VFPPC_18231 [Pochonia chlamydosporia 170]
MILHLASRVGLLADAKDDLDHGHVQLVPARLHLVEDLSVHIMPPRTRCSNHLNNTTPQHHEVARQQRHPGVRA